MDIKVATERLNNCIEDGYIDASSIGGCIDEDFIALKVLLAELDSKDKQIEELREQLDEANMSNVIRFKKESEKDKVIELMAEFISQHDTDEEICKNIATVECKNCECKDCLKQYFENKAKEMK